MGLADDASSGVIAGVKLPTGSTDEPFNGPAGGIVDPSLQPGTGSTDLLLGGFYSGAYEKLGWFAQGLWQHAIASNAGYTPGDAMTLNAGLTYADMGQAVVPLFQVNYVHRNIDRGNPRIDQYRGRDNSNTRVPNDRPPNTAQPNRPVPGNNQNRPAPGGASSGATNDMRYQNRVPGQNQARPAQGSVNNGPHTFNRTENNFDPRVTSQRGQASRQQAARPTPPPQPAAQPKAQSKPAPAPHGGGERKKP